MISVTFGLSFMLPSRSAKSGGMTSVASARPLSSSRAASSGVRSTSFTSVASFRRWRKSKLWLPTCTVLGSASAPTSDTSGRSPA